MESRELPHGVVDFATADRCKRSDRIPYLPSLGAGASLLDVFRSFPESSKPLIEYHEVLLRGASPFNEAQRELIAAYVSGLNHCNYCHGVHTATAERLGIEEGLVSKLLEHFDTAEVTDEMKPVLRYARKLTEQPGSIGQADADAVLAAGWDESAIFHTVAVTALFNFMNRLVEGLGIEFNPAYAREASQRLAEKGYLPLLNMLER
ncbi:MAG: peroxidase-related enzyme [Woeseia sp.]